MSDSAGRLEERDDDLFDQGTDPTIQRFRDFWVVQLQVVQSLYSGGVNRQQIAIAKLTHEAALIQLQATIDNVLRQVKTAVYAVVIDQAQLEAVSQTIKLLQEEGVRQKDLFDAGRTTRFNVLRTQVSLGNQQAQVSTLQTDLVTEQIALSRLVNVEWSRGASPDQPPFPRTGLAGLPAGGQDQPRGFHHAGTGTAARVAGDGPADRDRAADDQDRQGDERSARRRLYFRPGIPRPDAELLQQLGERLRLRPARHLGHLRWLRRARAGTDRHGGARQPAGFARAAEAADHRRGARGLRAAAHRPGHHRVAGGEPVDGGGIGPARAHLGGVGLRHAARRAAGHARSHRGTGRPDPFAPALPRRAG